MFKSVESVTQGQSDKICDQIADAIVDEYLRRDPQARVDINVLGAHGMMMVGGEVTSLADFDCGALAKKVYKEIGYDDELEVFVNIEQQSEEMQKVKSRVSDTVIVNGYATSETREFLPRPLVFAHALARRLDDLRKTNPEFFWLLPDGKVQLVMDKDKVKVVTILASHKDNIDEHQVQSAILERVVAPIVGDESAQIHINPIGAFTKPGFQSDAGASGHCPAIDTYGGLIPQADVNLSGKDPWKAERAGTYMTRFVAKYLVEQGLCSSALVQLAYTLGRSEPVAVQVFGTTDKSRGAKLDLTNLVKKDFDFRPEAIVEKLKLLTPIYRETAVYGHFGRFGFPWEAKNTK